MTKHKVCLIGAGGIANAHWEAYRRFPERAEIAAVCDIDIDKAKRFAAQRDIPRVYIDAKEMLQAEKPDCVSICTWNSAHAECTILALESGANVLCEKPMALNAAQAQAMQDAAKKCGKLLQVGFVRRFGNDAEAVKRMVDADVLGDIYFAKVYFIRRDGSPGGWFADKSYAGGGPLIDLGVHMIDLARYLGGNPKPVSAFGVTYTNIGSNRAMNAQGEWRIETTGEYARDVEDLAVALIRFDNGLTLSLETSYNLNCEGNSRGVQLYGTKAGVRLEPNMEVFNDLGGMYVNTKPQGNADFQFSIAFANEVKGFLDAVDGIVPCRATAEDGVLLMKILDAVYESARIGRSVDINV